MAHMAYDAHHVRSSSPERVVLRSYVLGMHRTDGSAAAEQAPESANTVPELYRKALSEAAHAASVLASVCRDAEASPQHILRTCDQVLSSAGLLRGLAHLSSR